MAILTETFEGTPGGMNLALPQQELDDTEARYIQDGLVDYPGLTRRRGPVRKVTGVTALTRKASGIVMTLNPLGVDKYAVLNGDGSNGYFSVLSDDVTAVNSDLAWPHPLPTTPPSAPYRIVDAKPGLLGGVMVGVSSAYDSNSPNQGIAYWVGGNKPNYANTVTVVRGSTALTGTGFSGTVVPGMWVFANTDEGYTSTLVGLVRSVNSDTSVTLAAGSPYNVTAKSGTFQSLRGLTPRVVTGRITCDTSSAAVTGGATKFKSQALDVGTWQLYRQSDMSFIGKVSSVSSEISLTLTANAAVAVADSSYVAIRADADYSIANTGNKNKVGFLSATYADRQWYANNGAQYEKTSRIWFSDSSDPEALDLSDFDGDWLDVTSSSTVNEPIRAIMPANNGLLVFKENETFIITGSSPSSFAVRKLEDDGALGGMSVVAYGGGVLWAGREGIHYYNGVEVENLTAPKLGDYWKNTIRTFDPTKYRMWSMVNRDHYMLFIENIAPTIPVVKGVTSTTPTQYTVSINMATRAITLLTNLNLRGAVNLPASSGKATWYIVNDATKGNICEGEALFSEEDTDQINCEGTIAPTLTASGNEITDAVRTANVQGDGLAAPDSSFGIWPSTTNLVQNGGFETNTTGWGINGSATIARDSTVKKFGSSSLKVVAAGAGAYEGTFAGLIPGLVAGTNYTLSFWANVPVGNTIATWIDWRNAGGTSVGSTTQLNVNGTGTWQRVTITATAPATTTQFYFSCYTASAQAVTYYVDGVQMEVGLHATPYVQTDGSTASRGSSSVTAPASLLNATQGWFAVRVRMGVSSAELPNDGSEELPALFGWGNAWNDGIRAMYYKPANGWDVQRGNSINTDTTFVADSFSRGDYRTVVVAWTSTTVYLSLNGGTFWNSPGTHIPTAQPSTFWIGQQLTGASQTLAGEMKWFACGKGLLTDADAATLNALGNTDPTFSTLPYTAKPTAIWNANTATYAVPPAGPDFFFESKKYDAGDSLRLKRFKQLAVHYLVQGDTLQVDTVLGLNNLGLTLTNPFPASVYTWDTLKAAVANWAALSAQFSTWAALIGGVFIPKRVRFLKRSQHLSFRLWQNSAGIQRLQIGPYSIGYKLMRTGRV